MPTRAAAPVTPSTATLDAGQPAPKSGRGGRRPGAGRKPTGKVRELPHRARPPHDDRHPAHVALRAVPRLPSLAKAAIVREIFFILRLTAERGPRTGQFRILHIAVQPRHLHLVVEADSAQSLGRGLQGLASGLARRVNHIVLERRGRVFGDRYHVVSNGPLTAQLLAQLSSDRPPAAAWARLMAETLPSLTRVPPWRDCRLPERDEWHAAPPAGPTSAAKAKAPTSARKKRKKS